MPVEFELTEDALLIASEADATVRGLLETSDANTGGGGGFGGWTEVPRSGGTWVPVGRVE